MQVLNSCIYGGNFVILVSKELTTAAITAFHAIFIILKEREIKVNFSVTTKVTLGFSSVVSDYLNLFHLMREQALDLDYEMFRSIKNVVGGVAALTVSTT